MQVILQQHSAEGKPVHLQAVNTLYLSLLESAADDSAWQLFMKVASCPLTTTKFIPKCEADDGYYGMRGAWIKGACAKAPHCGHGNVEITHTVRLDDLDQHRLNMGHVIGAHAIMSWWGKQMADALGAAFTQTTIKN